jgi:hypothetical protein
MAGNNPAADADRMKPNGPPATSPHRYPSSIDGFF